MEASQAMNQNQQKIEIEYTKAKLSKRFVTYVIDLGLIGTFAVILFALTNLVTKNTEAYKNLENNISEIRNESGLYIDGVDIITYTKDENNFSSYEDRKNFLSNHIDSFYVNPSFFTNELSASTIKEYNTRKLNAKGDNNIPLFVSIEGQIKERPVAPEQLYNFYSEEISSYSYSYLFYNAQYVNLIKASFWTVTIEVVICATLMFSIVYLLFPAVIFKRGRQTPGMKMMKIGLINYHAVNVKTGVYIGQFFFILLVMFYLSFFAFLIPAIVSISMTFIGKTSPSLASYVFNNYFVDVKNQDIYLDEVERTFAQEKVNEASIENKDLKIEH